MYLKNLIALVLAATLGIYEVAGLKHSFVARHDGRFFIGPIGLPYGFVEKGIYKLKVSDFHLSTRSSLKAASDRKRKKNNKKNKNKKGQTDAEIEQESIAEAKELEGLHAGFILKRFENEADFAREQEQILENPNYCIFQQFMDDVGFDSSDPLHNDHKDHGHDHDHDQNSNSKVATGPGVVDGGAEGIFLSMRNPKFMWRPHTPEFNHTFVATEVGYYFLIYQYCLEEGVDKDSFLFKEIRSNFRLDFEYRNFDALNNPSYLSAGEMMLPHMYLYFSVSYAILLIMWVRALNWDDKHNGARPTVYAIHHLMSSVVALKTLSIFFESVRYHFIRVNGHAELWSFVYYIITFLKGTFLFTVLLLIGSGWSFFKPFLNKKERLVIFFVFFLQVIDNVAIVVLTQETMGERLYKDWSAILHLVDIISCCAILIPIVWQVNSLEKSIEGADDDEDEDGAENGNGNGNGDRTTEAQNGSGNGSSNGNGNDGNESDSKLQAKLSLFRSFYISVVAYIYFTRIVVYLFASTLPYNHTWLRYLATELGTLLFYFVIGIKFRPTVESGYDSVKNNEDDDEGEVIELGPMPKTK